MYRVPKERFFKILSSFSTIKEILVIGDLGIDKYTQGNVSRISPEAPVPVLEVTTEWYKLGLAANVSENLCSLGVKNKLVGLIGDDTHGELLLSILEDIGSSLEGIFKVKERPTTFKERIMSATQQICRIDYESVEEVSAQIQKDILAYVKKQIGKSSAVILEDYSKGFLTQSLLESFQKICKENAKILFVDPGKETPPLFYKGASFLKPNLSEAYSLAKSLGSSERDLKSLANFLAKKLDLDFLAITLGKDGMAVWDKKEKGEKFHIIEGIAIDVYDVSGAGDTAISLLSSALLSGASLKEAAFIANCASSVVVGKKGTATLTLEELKEFYRSQFC